MKRKKRHRHHNPSQQLHSLHRSLNTYYILLLSINSMFFFHHSEMMFSDVRVLTMCEKCVLNYRYGIRDDKWKRKYDKGTKNAFECSVVQILRIYIVPCLRSIRVPFSYSLSCFSIVRRIPCKCFCFDLKPFDCLLYSGQYILDNNSYSIVV